MDRIEGKDKDITGIALSAAFGFGIGLVGGMLLRQFVVSGNTERVKEAARRLKESPRGPKEALNAIEDAVVQAWEDDPDLRPLPLTVEALGEGIIEITGTAPSQITRQLACDVARSVPGADVVLNRIHIEETLYEESESKLAPETG